MGLDLKQGRSLIHQYGIKIGNLSVPHLAVQVQRVQPKSKSQWHTLACGSPW